MSMLMRYRKQGGFQQLLTLIETCHPERRAQLLSAIQMEDPGWAALLKTKMLTLEKIFSWPATLLTEVTNEIPAEILACVLVLLTDEARENTLKTLQPALRHEVEQILKDSSPTADEIEAGRVTLLTLIRELDRDFKIDLASFDPALSTRESKAA